MIKVQKQDFNIEKEITKLKDKYSNVGAINTFIGYVRDLKIKDRAIKNWKLTDCLIIHRYGKLYVNDKIVLVACFSENRNNSFESSKFIMDYLKKNAPFWKREYYSKGSSWLENIN